MSKREGLDFGKLAINAMHDIQSPLAILQMTIQSLQGVNERYFTFANEAIQQIRNIITDFIERYHIPEPIMIEHCETIALAPILLTAVILKQQLFSNRAIHFECLTPTSADHIYVRVNASLLKRLLSNLLNNTIEAIAHKGYITVNLKYDYKQVAFSIQNSNYKIKNHTLKTMPAYSINLEKNKNQADKNYSTNLAIVRQWLASWQGTIAITAKKRHNTIITITLPRCYQQ